MKLTHLVHKAWQAMRPYIAAAHAAAAIGTAAWLALPPEYKSPDPQNYALERKAAFSVAEPAEFTINNTTFQHTPGILNAKIQGPKGKQEFRHISTPTFSPSKDKLAFTTLNELVIYSEQGIKRIPHLQGKSSRILGWQDENNLRILERDIYEINVNTQRAEYITTDWKDWQRYTAIKYNLAMGIMSSFALWLLPTAIRLRKQVRKPQHTLDYLVAYPGTAAGSLGTGTALLAWPAHPFMETASQLSACSTGLLVGTVAYTLLAATHTFKSPILLNLVKAARNKDEELVQNEGLRLFLKSQKALQKEEYEAALEYEEKRCAHQQSLPMDWLGSALLLLNMRDAKKEMRKNPCPARKYRMIDALLSLGRTHKAQQHMEEMLEQGRDWDPAIVLAGLRMAQSGEGQECWRQIVRRLRDDFENTNSRNKVLRIGKQGLLRDSVIIEQYPTGGNRFKWQASKIVWQEHQSKYDVTRPVISFNDGIFTYDVYQITSSRKCGLRQGIERLKEFHERMRRQKNEVPFFDFEDVYHWYCCERIPEEHRNHAKQTAQSLLRQLESMQRTFIHGDATHRNMGECNDAESKKHVCIWDFEQCAQAPSAMDFARYGIEAGQLDQVLQMKQEPHILAAGMFDCAKLITSRQARGISAEDLVEQLLKMQEKLGEHKEYAQCWAEISQA